MSGEQFSLVWNSFPRNLSSGLYTLLTDEQLVDVTLAAEGQILRAHKLILSVCSTYFRELFKGNSCKHPIVILKDVNYRDLSAMLHFMYQGEVNIKQEDIASFLKVAETLQIKGLTTGCDEKIDESMTKSAEEDLDDVFDVEKNKTDFPISDADTQALDKSNQSLNSQSESHEQNLNPNSTLKVTQYAKEDANTNNIACQEKPISNMDYMAQNSRMFFNERCRSNGLQNTNNELLDCTAGISQPQKPKHEPLDYTLEPDVDTAYKSYVPDKIPYQPEDNILRQDFIPDTQLVTYSQNSQNQPFALQNDFTYDTTSYSRGRRTVKGIPNSSLPLETTLRVVSELGPTLRMERGKVIRMYSCPWCLRHFTRKENLKLHVRYIHGPLESLTCKLCGNKYKNSNSLRVHSYLYHNAKRDKHNKPLVSGGV